MPTYILDLVIERAQVLNSCPPAGSPVWIMIQADGVHQVFNTPAQLLSQMLQFNSPARFILTLMNLENSFLIAKLCTNDPRSGATHVLAQSQIQLSTLPKKTPKNFSFPLKSSYNLSKDAMLLTLTATISMLPQAPPTVQPQPPSYHSTPYPTPQVNPYQNSHNQNGNYNSNTNNYSLTNNGYIPQRQPIAAPAIPMPNIPQITPPSCMPPYAFPGQPPGQFPHAGGFDAFRSQQPPHHHAGGNITAGAFTTQPPRGAYPPFPQITPPSTITIPQIDPRRHH
ncbi:hypothetical protein TRFO_33495 [Tritrichomonas foetus]|uniref:Uncharacterized protein n=1 Tax=Tritrichomonas foetus TaxID=1144522 RepID=A0A1J4JRV8_9EUKA|nr:hypothetical protein TRFO_33495 [Tritrichomonas foetus]|eukprot:OHS99972.1 hypothetical protein TRFO_33495 [Tritrichomonas foetus]